MGCVSFEDDDLLPVSIVRMDVFQANDMALHNRRKWVTVTINGTVMIVAVNRVGDRPVVPPGHKPSLSTSDNALACPLTAPTDDGLPPSCRHVAHVEWAPSDELEMLITSKWAPMEQCSPARVYWQAGAITPSLQDKQSAMWATQLS